MRLAWLSAVGALGAACHGTEGTLLVLQDSPEGGSSSMQAEGGNPATAPGPYVPAGNPGWFAQLDGAADLTQDVDLFYLDPDQNEPADLTTLHAQGKHVLCYLSGGSLEAFRDDAGEFPDRVIGNALANYPNERWLDVRSEVVRTLMARRVTALAALGCDGIPPSSLAVHAADTGFDLTLNDALDYARFLAERIHATGMSAGLTGPMALTQELWPTFDFGLAIGCLGGSGCSEYTPFVQAKKPVLYVALGDRQSALQQCKSAQMLGFEALVSDPGFTGNCFSCRDIL
jgi:hypothetical protein